MSGERPTQGHNQHATGGAVLWEEQCSTSRGRQSEFPRTDCGSWKIAVPELGSEVGPRMPGVRTELTLNKEPSLEENDYGCELVAPKCQMELTLPEQMSSGQGAEQCSARDTC